MVMGGAWLYGSGFPKSLDVAKAIDKAAPRAGMFDAFAAHYGERRRARGLNHRQVCELGGFYGEHNKGGASVNWEKGYNVPTRTQWSRLAEILDMPHDMWAPLIDRVEAEREITGSASGSKRPGFSGSTYGDVVTGDYDLTAPATDAAREWQGWGTALKPAHEPFILARKPLDAPTTTTTGPRGEPLSLADYFCADEPAHVFAYHADCLTFLRQLPDNWTHAIITDPPYGLADHKAGVVADAITAWASGDRERVPDGKGFMGRDWDAFVPPPAVWDECLRVLKPGGHLAVFAGSRTVDLMGLSIRLAGFEMRDSIAAWLYGSGFPKSLDVGKAIDKRGGADIGWFGPWLRQERRRRGISSNQLAEHFPSRSGGMTGCVRNWELSLNLPTVEQFNTLRRVLDLPFDDLAEAEREVIGERATGHGTGRGTVAIMGDSENRDITAPATDAAREWQGWGTALKPAHEPILLARKPLEGTVAANVLAHRAGALNVDACRVAHGADVDLDRQQVNFDRMGYRDEARPEGSTGAATYKPGGRWPSNVVLAHHSECGPDLEPDQAPGPCVPGCQVAALDEQSAHLHGAGAARKAIREADRTGMWAQQGDGHRFGDEGGASRFFPTFRYQAKAPKTERPIVDGTGHPTVKPLGLMRWLVRLLVPGPDGNGEVGCVLDPFAGSGATLEAARLEGRRAVGIERDEHSCRLIAERLASGPADEHPPTPVVTTVTDDPEPETAGEPLTLFG